MGRVRIFFPKSRFGDRAEHVRGRFTSRRSVRFRERDEPVNGRQSDELGELGIILRGGWLVEESGALHRSKEQCESLRIVSTQFLIDGETIR